MAELTKEEFNAGIERIAGGNSAPKIPDSVMGKTIDDVKKFGAEVAPLIVGFNRLATGATAAETALAGIGKIASFIPGLSGFGSAIGEAGTALLKNKSQMDEAGKMGLGGNNLGLYNQQVAQLGVTTTEYNQLMKTYGNNINGLAGSAQRSSEAFTKLGSDVRDSGTGRQLQQLGVSTEELAQITALSVMNGKKLAAQGTEDYKKQSAAAQELAQQIAETSLITGMSRDAISKSIETETKKPGVMLAMMQMDEQGKKNFLQTQAQLAPLGDSVKAFASEIVTGGVRTKEGIATMTALGPAGEELQRAIKLQQSLSANASESEKLRAKEAVDMATAKVNERIASKEYAQIANTATGETANQMLKIAGENKGVQTQMAAVQEAGGNLEAAIKAQRAEAQARIAGQKVDENGKPVTAKNEKGEDVRVIDEGTRLSRTLNDANARAAIQAEGLARNMKNANDALGKSPDAINTFNQLLRLSGTATTGKEAEVQGKEFFDKNLNTRKGAEPAAPGYKGTSQPIEDLAARPKTKLAEGGVVEPQAGGTDATIGEGGKPEAVIPLDKLDGMMKSKDSGGINIAEISKTISTTLSSAQTPNEGKKLETDKGPLEAVLSDYQKTVLKYAATEGEMKQVQIDNEKNIIRGSEAGILENKKRIAEIEKDADGRELTRREQSRVERIQAEIQGQQESLAMHKEALAVYENIDALSNQTVVDNKKTTADETMASLKEQEAAGYAANKAASLARDALEEKAEAEGRSMTEAEEAQYKLLGVELNASSNKITSAQEAQKALERAESDRAFQAKVQQQRDEMAKESAIQATEIAKVNAEAQTDIQKDASSSEIAIKESSASKASEVMAKVTEGFSSFAPSLGNLTKELESGGIRTKESAIQMSLLGPAGSKYEEALKLMNSAVTDDQKEKAKLQMQQAESAIAERTKSKEYAQMVNMSSLGAEGKVADKSGVGDKKKQMEGMFANIGGAGGILGDMFNPKIIDTKLAEANKAKLAEVKKEEPKATTPAAKPAEKSAESKQTDKEIGIKDLNDQLKMLNMNMLKLISHSETISGASEKTAKNSAKATGNRYA